MPSVSTTKNVKSQKQAMLQDLAFTQLNKTFGNSGTQTFGGRFMDEYASEWRDEERIETVESMRRGDGSCRAALRAVKAPVLATKWDVKTDDESAKGEEIKEFVKQNLFNMRRTWKEFLRESLAYLDFGHYVFEMIFEKREGKVWLADLEPRIPASIHKWELQDGSFGVVQFVRNDLTKAGSYLEIPGNKCLILTNEKEGDDVTGQSILRSAYMHWDMKKMLCRVQAMSAERFGMGIPVIKLGQTAGQTEKAEAEEMGAATKSNEANYLVIGQDWEFDIKTPDGNPQGAAIIEGINHHAKMILVSILAGFLGLGGDKTGSFGLSKDLSSFFFKLVGDICSYKKEQIDNQVIRRLVDINFGKQEKYPYVDYAPLEDLDPQILSSALSTLATAGLVHKTSRLVDWVHQTFQLPTLTEEDKEEIDAKILEGEMNALLQPNEQPAPGEDKPKPGEKPAESEEDEDVDDDNDE